jgi:hypothetical protein
MSMGMGFLSDEWRKVAITEINRDPRVRNGFQAPESFSHRIKMVCENRDRAPIVSYLVWQAGLLVEWQDGAHEPVPMANVWMELSATRENWERLAKSDSAASSYLLRGRLQISKGSLVEGMKNAAALNALVRVCSKLDTDWS